MSKDYLMHMSFFVDTNNNTSMIYDHICNIEFKIDKLLDDFDNNLEQQTSEKTTATPCHESAKTFRNSNAMNIDATNFNKSFKSLISSEEIKKCFLKVIQRRCKVCGLAAYKHDDSKYQRSVCSWCSKKGHWNRVCLS